MGIERNIKKLREEHGLTQEQLGEIAGVSDKAVSTWETGSNFPRMGAIQKMADYFGISKSAIIEDKQEETALPYKSTTAERLAEYMRIHQMRQVDILEAVAPYSKDLGIKIQKSEISQYLSGKFEPGNDKIYVLSVALGLNPLWLMGYDEPMYKTSEQDSFKSQTPTETADERYEYAAELLTKLSTANQKIIMKLTPQNIDRLFGYAERLVEEQSSE